LNLNTNLIYEQFTSANKLYIHMLLAPINRSRFSLYNGTISALIDAVFIKKCRNLLWSCYWKLEQWADSNRWPTNLLKVFNLVNP